ncbi:helix-turn-helix domain-containing protein [Deinococcus sp.]|uniref:helix-turn-helix domain-containing protein n=1 Tax=Deinococcus sp. TaxID=47478 RepID=UPI0025F02162|nr:helix-turn-helix domain-containing protein [Deinococcus sp.]
MTASLSYLPTLQEQAQLESLASTVPAERPRLCLQVIGSAQPVELPEALAELVALLIREGAAGHAVSVVLPDEEVGTIEAARMLGISRPFLVSHLLDTGKLAFHKVGSHRRITLRDLLAYQTEQVRRRRLAAALSAEDQALGLY